MAADWMLNTASRLGAKHHVPVSKHACGTLSFRHMVFFPSLVHGQQEHAAIASAGAAQISRVPAGSLHHDLNRPRPRDDS
jgi:hypothetical protein